MSGLAARFSVFQLLVIQPRRSDSRQGAPCRLPPGQTLEKHIAAALNQAFLLAFFLKAAENRRGAERILFRPAAAIR